MKLLFLADVHIKLGQKKVPIQWQTKRFTDLFQAIQNATCEHDISEVIIGGDLFDSPKPSVHELVLGISLVNSLTTPVTIFAGNHECTSKRESILSILQPLFKESVNIIDYDYRSEDYDIIPYTHLHNEKWLPPQAKLLMTHVRGNIGTLVKSEIDLDKFKQWPLVLAGDLHDHSMTQENIVYPGSPVNTNFSRERSENEHGFIIVDTDTLEWEFHPLDLPQLIRKTVTSTDQMLKSDYDHVIYEIAGDSVALANVKDHELLDKKVNTEYQSQASLDLQNKTYSEELAYYLSEVQQLEPEEITRLITKVKQYDRDS